MEHLRIIWNPAAAHLYAQVSGVSIAWMNLPNLNGVNRARALRFAQSNAEACDLRWSGKIYGPSGVCLDALSGV